MTSSTNNTNFLIIFIPLDPNVEAITSPQPIITGVPSFNNVFLDACLVIYPPKSFGFFIFGNNLKYFLLN